MSLIADNMSGESGSDGDCRSQPISSKSKHSHHRTHHKHRHKKVGEHLWISAAVIHCYCSSSYAAFSSSSFFPSLHSTSLKTIIDTDTEWYCVCVEIVANNTLLTSRELYSVACNGNFGQAWNLPQKRQLLAKISNVATSGFLIGKLEVAIFGNFRQAIF